MNPIDDELEEHRVEVGGHLNVRTTEALLGCNKKGVVTVENIVVDYAMAPSFAFEAF